MRNSNWTTLELASSSSTPPSVSLEAGSDDLGREQVLEERMEERPDTQTWYEMARDMALRFFNR